MLNSQMQSALVNSIGIVFHQDNVTHIGSDSPEALGSWFGGSYASTRSFHQRDHHLLMLMVNNSVGEKLATEAIF